MRLLISTLHFTQALRMVPAKAFARANVPLRLVMGTGETAGNAAAASARPLAGPWRRTMYELYDWVSPLGAEGDVQNELVERATLEQQPCRSGDPQACGARELRRSGMCTHGGGRITIVLS